MSTMPMSVQLINLRAALMLLIAFAMLAQRRILSAFQPGWMPSLSYFSCER